MARMVMMTKLMLILMSKENHSICEDIGEDKSAYDTINGNVVMATSESGCGDLILSIIFFIFLTLILQAWDPGHVLKPV